MEAKNFTFTVDALNAHIILKTVFEEGLFQRGKFAELYANDEANRQPKINARLMEITLELAAK